MKNIYVKGRDGSNSLPILIKLFQYNKAWNSGNYGFDYNSKASAAFGNMGDKFFDFSFDCLHEFPLGEINKDDPFKYINNILKVSPNPIIKREEITERYFVLECPDFGSQSMTAFYRDFVPQVWYKGRKIWQMYIGIIKHYPRKLAYILIPKKKTINGEFLDTNLEDTNLEDENLKTKVSSSDYDDFVIRAVFKNNIEDIYAIDQKAKYYSLKTTLNATHEEIAKIELENIDVFTSRDVHEDFDLYFREVGETTWRKVLNSRMFYKLELVPDFDDGYTVERQTKSRAAGLTNINSLDTNLEDTYDYYKQSYFRDYVDNDKDSKKDQEYNRSANTQYSLFITLSLDENAKQVEVCLVPRSNLYDAMYITKNQLGKFDIEDIRKYFPVKYPEDIMLFDKAGNKIADPGNTVFSYNSVGNETEYEVIPEYSSIKKYEWKNVSNLSLDSDNISAFLRKNSLYPWATRHPEVLGFKNGKLRPQLEYNYKTGSLSNSDDDGKSFDDLIIYWNEEEHIKDDSSINSIADIDSTATGEDLTQFTDDDSSTIFASETKSYDILSDENFVSRLDLVDKDDNDSIDTRYSAIFPYNDSNLELSKVLDSNEPKFHVDNKNYIYLNYINDGSNDTEIIDYDNFKSGVEKLTPELDNSDYKYIRNSREQSVDVQFDSLSKNIIDMFYYGKHEIYSSTDANSTTKVVPFNTVSEYFLLEFTKEDRAAVYLLEQNSRYSDIKSAEFVSVFKRGDSYFGVYIPSGSQVDTSKACLYSPNNYIKKLHILRQS